jgi:hypothetical protein
MSIWASIKAIIGGTPEEVLAKIILGFVTLAVAAINDSSFFIMAFLFGILFDAILGTMVAVKEGGWKSVKFMRWMTGPLLKGAVITMFLVTAAILDMVVNKTPVQYMGSSPIVITASVVGVGAIVMDIARKAQKLTGYKIGEWIGSAIDRFRPKKDGE